MLCSVSIFSYYFFSHSYRTSGQLYSSSIFFCSLSSTNNSKIESNVFVFDFFTWLDIDLVHFLRRKFPLTSSSGNFFGENEKYQKKNPMLIFQPLRMKVNPVLIGTCDQGPSCSGYETK
jgi:hypothetical protein